VSVLTAFIDGRSEYIWARLLLGVAEAGFYPGVIFYLTLWLPRPVRSRVMAMFLLALPVCNCIGSPVSSHILLLNGAAGLSGWQWLFILEGAPALLLGVVTWLVLVDGPWNARWLAPGEREQLQREMHCDELSERTASGKITAHIARDAIAYFMLMTGLYGLSFWLPKILAAGGVSATATGWWAALPYGAGSVAMVLASRLRGRGSLTTMYLVSAAGFLGAGLVHSLPATLTCFCFASMGVYGALPLFWSASTGRMSSKVAGAAIAMVNSLGATGGFAGPYAIGWLHDATHTYSAGLWAIAASVALGAVTVSGAGLRRKRGVEQPQSS
jgi:ACS family tartrate transporter-like MFS transporter